MSMHPSSVMGMHLPNNGESARYSNGSNFSDDDTGIFMTIDNEKGTEFFGIEPPKALLTKNNASQQEKQISVDPISLQGSATIRQASFRLVSPPSKGSDPNAPPPKLKFVSTSLPSSTSSSPVSMPKKKLHKKFEQHNIYSHPNNLTRIQSAMDDAQLALAEANTRKSKSLGEGRTSGATDDFDLWLEKSNQNPKRDPSNNKFKGVSKPPLGPAMVDRRNSTMKKSKSRDPNNPEDGFKCGRLCIFLPRGKGKPVRSISSTSTMTQLSSKSEPLAISRRVSLEKFECGSWDSSLEDQEGGCADLFFDLPMELLRCSVSDMQSPVTAAFVFDNNNDDDGDTDKNKENDKDVEVDFQVFLEAQS